MPGIVGYISPRARALEASMLEEMTACLRHEAFLTSGVLRQESLDLGVGWVRHAGSYFDDLPAWNARKDIGLIFVGEHFGQDVACPADPGGILRQYELDPDRFPKQLNGWFSGVVVDLRRQRVLLFNDRFGMGRVYWTENAHGFYFASEAKALLHLMPALRNLDEAGLGEFLSCGCTLRGRTLFSGVSLLPPASRWVFEPGERVSRTYYFNPREWEQQSPLGRREFAEQLKGTMARVVPLHFLGRQPVGMSLTGGIDGRMVMAWSGREADSLPCYTFGGTLRECADVRLARAIAAARHQPHEVITVGDEFLSDFPALAARAVSLSDGSSDVTGAVELYANRLAREIAPVRMTGNYGSEILRANIAFRPSPAPSDLFSPASHAGVRGAAVTYVEEARGNRLSFIAFKQMPWHHHARLSVEQSVLTVRSPFLDNEIVALAYRAPPGFAAGPRESLRLIACAAPELGRIPTDRGAVWPDFLGLNRLRRMKCEFLAKAEYAYDHGMPHRLARLDRMFSSPHVERFFLGRQKFYHFRTWYRGRLASCMKEILLDPRSLSRPYVNASHIERALRDHVAGTHNYTVSIHQLLTLELMQRQLLERR